MEEEIVKSDSARQVEELSTDEFQQKLYLWFKDNGLLSDLKSYLRYQMITKLRGTNLGQRISDIKPTTLSPKIQAINLLIADYLLRRHHHYTLSIFSSEVSLPFSLNTLPVYLTDNLNLDKDTHIFKTKDICDILDTIGFSRSTVEGEYILKDYQSNPQDGLLTCIIRCLSKSREIEYIDTIEDLQDSNIDINIFRWLTSIHKLLVKSKVKGAQLKFLKKHINNLFKTELDRIKVEESSKYKSLIEEKENFIHMQLSKKETFFKNKLKQYESKFKNYKQSLQKELQEKQKHLENLARQLQEQHTRVTENIFEVQSRSKELEFRENQIKQLYENKTHEISDLQKNLDYRTQMLDEREKVISNLQQILESNHDAIKSAINEQIHEVDTLKTQCLQLKQELEQTKSTVHSHIKIETQNKEKKSQNEIDIAEIKDMYVNVQSENSSLKAEVQNLTSCLDKLNRDLQTRSAMNNFFAPRNEVISINTDSTAPTDSQLPTRRRGPRLTRQLGGGEEAILPNERTTHMPRFRSFDFRDVRRRPVRKSSDSTSSSDTSPTDEIVKDARERLRKLKKESDAVERQYRKYRSKSPVKLTDDIRHAREEMLKNIEATNLYIPVFGRQNFNDVVKRIREGRKEYYDKTSNQVDLNPFYRQSEVLPQSETLTLDLNKRLEKTDILESSSTCENSNIDLKKKKVSFSNILNMETVNSIHEMKNEQFVDTNLDEIVKVDDKYESVISSPIDQSISTNNENREERRTALKISLDESQNQNLQYSNKIDNSEENTQNINNEYSKSSNMDETNVGSVVNRPIASELNQNNRNLDSNSKESLMSLKMNTNNEKDFAKKNECSEKPEISDKYLPKDEQTNVNELKFSREDIKKSTGAIKKKCVQKFSSAESPTEINPLNKNNMNGNNVESYEDISINMFGIPIINLLDYDLNNLVLNKHVSNKQNSYNPRNLELNEENFNIDSRIFYQNKIEKLNSDEKCETFLEETNDSKFTSMKITCARSFSVEDIESDNEPLKITEINQQIKSNTVKDVTSAVLSEMSCPETISKLNLLPVNQNIQLIDKGNIDVESDNIAFTNNEFSAHCTNLSQFQEVLNEIKKTIDDNEVDLTEQNTEAAVHFDSPNVSISSGEPLSDHMSIGFDSNIEDTFWS